VNSDSQVERLIEQRIQQAMQRDLPRLLINFFCYSHAESWPHWAQTNPGSIPLGVKNAKELERTSERITTEVLFGDTTFVFQRFKIGEDSVESDSYTYQYWTYELLVNDRVVLGTEIKDHWAGGKPALKEVTAYVPGGWENTFKALKSECEELARKTAAEATAERRRRNPPELKEKLRQQKIKERLDRFGLDENGFE
jgi:hypothetical protein